MFSLRFQVTSVRVHGKKQQAMVWCFGHIWPFSPLVLSFRHLIEYLGTSTSKHAHIHTSGYCFPCIDRTNVHAVTGAVSSSAERDSSLMLHRSLVLPVSSYSAQNNERIALSLSVMFVTHEAAAHMSDGGWLSRRFFTISPRRVLQWSASVLKRVTQEAKEGQEGFSRLSFLVIGVMSTLAALFKQGHR